jgi:type IV secretion system protein VirB10
MKDPFQNLPEIDQEDEVLLDKVEASDLADADEDITEGAPSRSILHQLQKFGVPIAVAALFAWIYYSPDPAGARAKPPANVEVDELKQVTESGALLASLRKDAEKNAPPKQPAMPSSSGAVPSTHQPLPMPSTAPSPAPVAPLPPPPRNLNPFALPESDPVSEQAKRELDLRSSELEAGNVRLRSGSGAPEPKAKPGTQLANLEGQLAQVAAQRDAAARSQQEQQDRFLAALSPKDTPKVRDQNEEFLGTVRKVPPQVTQLQPAVGPYVLYEGSVIRAVLQSDVTSELPGRLIARVSSDVFDQSGRHVLIPKGSRLNGLYNSQVVVGQQRMLMAMTRLILPNGTWLSLAGTSASDHIGVSGMSADVNNHFFKMFGSSLVLGAVSLALPRSDTGVVTTSGQAGGGNQTAGSVFSTSMNEVLKTLLERNKSIPPTLSLTVGQEFTLIVSQDLALEPYR